MRKSELVDGTGRTLFQFGGQQAFKTKVVKDYVVSFEWARDPDNRKRIAKIMAIWSARPNSHDSGAWVLTDRAMHLFCDGNNRPTLHCFTEAEKALTILGRMPLRQEIHALVDVVMACVDDLVQMRRAPNDVGQALERRPIFDIQRRTPDGKVLSERSV